MANLNSNSSNAAIAINSGIAAELEQPKRLFGLMRLSSKAIALELAIAMENGDWHLIALIALSQASNEEGHISCQI